MYRHTQPGTLLLWILVPAAVILAVLAFVLPSSPGTRAGQIVIFFTLVVLLAAAVVFHSMTISVGDGELTWSFGRGVFRKSVATTDIAEVEAVRTGILEGWGIHLTARGWLYNVSGRAAVRVRLRNRKQFLLGTDEPDRLIAAINSALR